MHRNEREWRETRHVSRAYVKKKKSYPAARWVGLSLAAMGLLITLVEVLKWSTVL